MEDSKTVCLLRRGSSSSGRPCNDAWHVRQRTPYVVEVVAHTRMLCTCASRELANGSQTANDGASSVGVLEEGRDNEGAITAQRTMGPCKDRMEGTSAGSSSEGMD